MKSRYYTAFIEKELEGYIELETLKKPPHKFFRTDYGDVDTNVLENIHKILYEAGMSFEELLEIISK